MTQYDSPAVPLPDTLVRHRQLRVNNDDDQRYIYDLCVVGLNISILKLNVREVYMFV